MKSQATHQPEVLPTLNSPATFYRRRESVLVIAALSALYFAVVAVGTRRYVWFDELFTLDIGQSTSLHQLWYRVQSFDCQPPPIYLLSRISMSIFGTTSFGLRFPSMVEFYLGSIAILLYVRRKSSLAFGAVAVLMLWGIAPTLYYAVEARPYALVFMSFSCLLLSWDIAIRDSRRRGPLLGIFFSALALTVAHVFAPFTLFAFCVAEAMRFRRLQKPDYALWAALLVPTLAALLYIPLVRLYAGIVYSQQASPSTLRMFFEDTLCAPLMALVLLVAFMIPWRIQSAHRPLHLLPEEIGLLCSLLLSPIFLILILIHRQGMFYNRYGMTSQVAMLAALAMVLAYRLRSNRLAAYAISAVLAVAILKDQVWKPLLHPKSKTTGVLASLQPNLPIVISEGTVFMEMNQWENRTFLKRLYFLKDRQAALQFEHTNFFQDFEAPDAMQKAGFPFAANIASYSGFVAEHRQFFLFGTFGQWLFPKLLSSGASIAILNDYGGAMPYSDSTLYLVTMPPQSTVKQ